MSSLPIDLAESPAATSDPVLRAIARAPVVRRLTDAQRAELDAVMDDIANGRATLVAHEDVPAYLDKLARDDANR